MHCISYYMHMDRKYHQLLIYFMKVCYEPHMCVCMCSGIHTRISCPNYEVVRVFQPGFQPQIWDKLALDSG